MLTVRAFTFNPAEENTYLLYNENKHCCIIDPGCYFPQERATLQSAILAEGLQPVVLVNTHCHLDHVFGNKFVHETWGLSLHFHEKEKPVFDFAPASGKLWQLPFDNYEGPLVYLKEGNYLKIDEDELEIRFVPGHSPGHICFYDKMGGYVIAGDTLFNGSIGRTDLPGGDFDTLIKSIRTQLFTCPTRRSFIPAMDRQLPLALKKRITRF